MVEISALVADPTLKDRIVVVWLGGHAYHWPNTYVRYVYEIKRDESMTDLIQKLRRA